MTGNPVRSRMVMKNVHRIHVAILISDSLFRNLDIVHMSASLRFSFKGKGYNKWSRQAAIEFLTVSTAQFALGFQLRRF
jgi:hypothetical protein